MNLSDPKVEKKGNLNCIFISISFHNLLLVGIADVIALILHAFKKWTSQPANRQSNDSKKKRNEIPSKKLAKTAYGMRKSRERIKAIHINQYAID